LINAFNEIPPQQSPLERCAVCLITGLALLTAGDGAAASRSGRDGGLEPDCSFVTDGHGAAVSGRAGGASVSTRLPHDCPDKPVAAPSPALPAPSNRSPARSELPAAEVVVPQAAPVSVQSGKVRVPVEVTETPSALAGDPVRAGATVVTSGVMIWLLQSSLLASLLVLGVPIWRHVDLLAVVSNPEEAGQQRSEPEDATLSHVLEAGSDHSRGMQA
jgi:hypothetical protein